VKEDSLKISAGELTPLQRAAWHRLWAILLAPVESQSAGTVDGGEAKPEMATPLRRQPKRSEADAPIWPKRQTIASDHSLRP